MAVQLSLSCEQKFSLQKFRYVHEIYKKGNSAIFKLATISCYGSFLNIRWKFSPRRIPGDFSREFMTNTTSEPHNIINFINIKQLLSEVE